MALWDHMCEVDREDNCQKLSLRCWYLQLTKKRFYWYNVPKSTVVPPNMSPYHPTSEVIKGADSSRPRNYGRVERQCVEVTMQRLTDSFAGSISVLLRTRESYV